jgi:hypothetical protein
MQRLQIDELKIDGADSVNVGEVAEIPTNEIVVRHIQILLAAKKIHSAFCAQEIDCSRQTE